MSDDAYGGYSIEQLRQFAAAASEPSGLSIEGPNRKVTAYFAAASALPDLLDAVESKGRAAPLLGLYQLRRRNFDGISDESESLLATGYSVAELRRRWNEKEARPEFSDDGLSLEFSGSTGGGCDSVYITVSIREVPQWDGGA